MGREPLAVIGRCAVEDLRFLLVIGRGHRGEAGHSGVHLTALGGLQQAGAHGLPVVAGPGRVHRRHAQHVVQPGHHLKGLQRFGNPIESLPVEILAALAGLRRDPGRAEVLLEVRDLPGKVLDTFWLEGDLEPLVEPERVGQFENLLLESCMLSRLDLAGLAGLLVDFGDQRLELAKRVIAQAGLRHPFVLQFEFPEQFRMVNKKDRTGVGDRGPGHHFEEPLGRLQLPGVTPELPRRHFLERHGASAADLQQRVARYGIEGLDPAIKQHRQPSKFVDMIFLILLGQHHRDNLRTEQGNEKPRGDLQQAPHATLRLKAKRSRWVVNWANSPALTNTHAR